MRRAAGRAGRQRGTSLAMVLMTLAVVLLLAVAGARTAVFGEKAARNGRDHQLALHAAEAALLDAEADLANPAPWLRHGFLSGAERTGLARGECGRGQDNALLGLCAPAADGVRPAWLGVDLLGQSAADGGVPYGRFTARAFPAGSGPLPARPPRYVIEILGDRRPEPGQAPAQHFRVTALGFGAQDITRVALQAWYRRTPSRDGTAAGRATRLGWREITNWSELRSAHEEN